ncbi:MAG: 23S rRNA (adenine(2030)-N(6))-methyltransferase RlmJ [Proteobacteria bacterium]|nr:23S rRNA (adenine(2030)-N(6))-methyltransferase RlmJ [Pseudomonadota bacterium]
MLSYQHAYHAGGPADVHKHAALCLLLERLAEKDKPFAVIDLYAGHGVYDLGSTEAQKTQEFSSGIARLWPLRNKAAPAAVKKLLAALAPPNPDGTLKSYPGSPALARAALRESDRLILNELHPAAQADLKTWARRDSRISVHMRDGLEALVGLVPPPIRRGLVVIDPSYEVKSEYADVPAALRKAIRKWREGIYFVWYPILADNRHGELVAGLEKGIPCPVLCCELMFTPGKAVKDAPGLRGTGLIVVNPPWQFDTAMNEAGAWMAKTMTANGQHTTRWLKPAGA